MYGMVNKAVQDLAVSLGGDELWDRIRTEAGIDDPSFVSLDAYDDDVTFRLVAAASSVLRLPPEEVLERFGEHWIRYTAQEGYGPLLGAYGRDLVSFLHHLDAMHARVRLTMPDLRPPSFTVDSVSESLHRIHYRSTRTGLAPMVVGLLRGLGARFGVPVQVDHVLKAGQGADHDIFELLVLAPVRGGDAWIPPQGTPVDLAPRR